VKGKINIVPVNNYQEIWNQLQPFILP
jgi:hypothetical protein